MENQEESFSLYGKILELPTVINEIHESCFRSSHILKNVIEMINRGDSKETINDFYMSMMEHSKEIKTSNDK